MSLANISIVGNVVRAPEQIHFASGKTKTTIVVAVNVPSRTNKEKGADGADFYRLETWGRLAELAATYLAKGNQITATGRLVLEKWTDKDGRDRMTPTVKADQIVFPAKPREASAPESVSGIDTGATVRAAPTSEPTSEEFADSGEISDQTISDQTTTAFNAAANALYGRSAVTTSNSAEIANVAPPVQFSAAAGNLAQIA